MTVMEENTRLLESLIENSTDYVKTSLKLARLKALDKTADVVSTVIPGLVVSCLMFSFALFFSLGVSFWLGGILGETSYGFYAVALFYGFLGIFLRLFMYKWLKKLVGNNFINQVLK